MIDNELQLSIDEQNKKLIASNIELSLNYSDRFYVRQFITHYTVKKGVLENFEKLLMVILNQKSRSIGLPSLAYCAEELHFLANYFGNLIRKETGKANSIKLSADTLRTA